VERSGEPALLERGRLAWPKVRLDPGVFARALAEHGATEVVYVEDFYLARACVEGDEAAVRAFDDTHLAQIGKFLARFHPSPEFLAEVRQELRDRLLVAPPGGRPRIAGYSGRGPLGAWVRVAAVRAALDLARGRGHAPEPAGGLASAVAPDDSPEARLVIERHRGAYEEALRRALGLLTVKERTLLRLHFVDGLSTERIGIIHQAHKATAARWIAAARQKLLDETYRELSARLQLSPKELASLTAVVRSELHVSVARLLGGSSD